MKPFGARTLVFEIRHSPRGGQLPVGVVIFCGLVNLLSIFVNVALIVFYASMAPENSPHRSVHFSLLACWVSMVAVVFCCGVLYWTFGRKS